MQPCATTRENKIREYAITDSVYIAHRPASSRLYLFAIGPPHPDPIHTSPNRSNAHSSARSSVRPRRRVRVRSSRTSLTCTSAINGAQRRSHTARLLWFHTPPQARTRRHVRTVASLPCSVVVPCGGVRVDRDARPRLAGTRLPRVGSGHVHTRFAYAPPRARARWPTPSPVLRYDKR